MKKLINQVCLKCGQKHGTKNKTAIGMWKGKCDICGKVTYVADAGHDFGIYRDEKHKLQD